MSDSRPKNAEYPQADIIVRNPPFIGTKQMIDALGESYIKGLRKVGKGRVPEYAKVWTQPCLSFTVKANFQGAWALPQQVEIRQVGETPTVLVKNSSLASWRSTLPVRRKKTDYIPLPPPRLG